MLHRIIKQDKTASGRISLPASKSISNRLLIINALSGGIQKISNLSNSDDTRVLEEALAGTTEIKDIGLAGTAMRFMTAYLAVTPGRWILTGADRMKERPVGKLVESLKTLGAEINYQEKTGYPPLEILGQRLNGGSCRVDSSISSQFVSALLMIAPVLKEGLELELDKKIISSAYIRLTLAIMKHAGIISDWQHNRISVLPQTYRPAELSVEPDWSAASYWYSIASLSESADLFISDLKEQSLQGDSLLPRLFEQFGVSTTFDDEGIRLRKSGHEVREFYFDFRDNPDLVQTFVVLCGLKGIRFRMEGTESLRIKETDRISALDKEMRKLGIHLKTADDGTWIAWDGNRISGSEKIQIDTYNDHRMAMAFAPAAWVPEQQISISNPLVVNKSYPDFWKDLQSVGCTILGEE